MNTRPSYFNLPRRGPAGFDVMTDRKGAGTVTHDKATTEAERTAERRATALRSHAVLVGDFDDEAQRALGVCNDGTIADDGLTAEGIDFADSILDAHHEARRDTPDAGSIDARRRKALKWYYEVDGEPYSDEACEAWGVTPEGDVGPEGLTAEGVEFADRIVAHLDAAAIRNHFAEALRTFTSQRPAARPARKRSDREQTALGATAALIESLGLRDVFRHALAAAARSIAEHIEAGVGDEGDAAPAGPVPTAIVSPSDVPGEVREAVQEWARRTFGADVEVVEVDVDRPGKPPKPGTADSAEARARRAAAEGDDEPGVEHIDLDLGGAGHEPGEPFGAGDGLVDRPEPRAATTEWPSHSTPPREASEAVQESHGASSSGGSSGGHDGGYGGASPVTSSPSSDSPSGDTGSASSGGSD